MLTWKSSCGGYAYTVIDGVDENIEFKCETQATPTQTTPTTQTTTQTTQTTATVQPTTISSGTGGWPTFLHDNQRTDVASGKGPGAGEVLWQG